MKMSDYATMHKNDGQKLETREMVSATALAGETVIVDDFVRIDKTRFDAPAYIIRLPDGTGFFTTSAMTKQIDKWIADGVEPESIKGCRFLVRQNTIPASNGKPETTYLALEFVE